MAQVCMLGHPAPGHVNPTLPVMTELVRRGEHVTYFATPPLRARIERTGATFASYGDHALFERGLAHGGMLGGMAALGETAELVLAAVLAAVERLRPDYLLLEAHSLVGHLVAQRVNVPAVTLCSMFAINEQLIPPRELVQHLYGPAPDTLALEGLRAFTRYAATASRLTRAFRVAAPRLIDYLANRQPLNIVLTSREFQVGAAAFDDSYCFVGMTPPAPAADDTDVLAQLDGRGRLVYVSMGTMYNDEAGLYRACFDAFAGGDEQVVLSVGQRIDLATLPAPPPNVMVRRHVPQYAVLERAAVFITHGGINSAHEAMAHGVPLIVLPLAADHHVVAQRVAEVGAGVVLERREVTARSLRALVDRVLADPNMAARSGAIGRSLLEAGGAVRAADAIQRHVATCIHQEGVTCSIRT